uniref:Outer mitochondrial membrane lipid metabolism regulator OPA3 n=1 Tax=Eptatretus burgeri TaxID=7764 RepID=A0A8C4QQI2_EPTBU
MVVGAFPAAKLIVLGIRHLNKPLAANIKAVARKSELFKSIACIWPAQLYHLFEMKAKMRMMGLNASPVNPLNEAAAVELGAELVGEFVIFIGGGACIWFEYSRQSANSQRKEQEKEARMEAMETQLRNLTLAVDELEARMRSSTLNRSEVKFKRDSIFFHLCSTRPQKARLKR